MCSGSVFFDLLPKVEIIRKLSEVGVGLLEHDGVVLELFLRQKQLNKLKISFLLFENAVLPEFLFLRQVAQNDFPTVLPG